MRMAGASMSSSLDRKSAWCKRGIPPLLSGDALKAGGELLIPGIEGAMFHDTKWTSGTTSVLNSPT